MPYAVTSTGREMKMPYTAKKNHNDKKVMKVGEVWHHTDGEMKQHNNPHNKDKKTVDEYA